jgi:hypothetical protein
VLEQRVLAERSELRAGETSRCALQRAGESALGGGARIAGQSREPVMAHAQVGQQRAGRMIREQHAALCIELDDRVGCARQQRLEPLRALDAIDLLGVASADHEGLYNSFDAQRHGVVVAAVSEDLKHTCPSVGRAVRCSPRHAGATHSAVMRTLIPRSRACSHDGIVGQFWPWFRTGHAVHRALLFSGKTAIARDPERSLYAVDRPCNDADSRCER